MFINKTSSSTTQPANSMGTSHATRPSNLPCSPPAINMKSRTSSKSSNPSPPLLAGPLATPAATATTPSTDRRDSGSSHYHNAIVFSQQFVDGKLSYRFFSNSCNLLKSLLSGKSIGLRACAEALCLVCNVQQVKCILTLVFLGRNS